jgi:hypothetical protein
MLRYGSALGCFAGALGLAIVWEAGRRRLAAARAWPRVEAVVTDHVVVPNLGEDNDFGLQLRLDTPARPRRMLVAMTPDVAGLAPFRAEFPIGRPLEVLAPPGTELAYLEPPTEGGGHLVPAILALGFLCAGVAILAGWLPVSG